MLLIFLHPPPKDVSILLSLFSWRNPVVQTSGTHQTITVLPNAKMSCPNNIAPGNFLMDSLMGGSSSFRGEGYSSNPGMYIHTAAEYGYSVMRNIGKVGPSPLSKRDEVPPSAQPLSGFQDAPYLSTQLATWTPGSKTSRDEQPVAAQCLQPCSFPAGNVKEEAFCCLYQDDSNKGKQTTESATYIRLGDNSCRPEQTASSSGCFQVYNNGERPQQDEQQFPSGFSLTHLATSVESASESTISCRKSAQDTPTTREVSKTDESQSRKEEKAKSDSCSDNSDGELKGRLYPPPPPPPSHTHTCILKHTHENIPAVQCVCTLCCVMA